MIVIRRKLIEEPLGNPLWFIFKALLIRKVMRRIRIPRLKGKQTISIIPRISIIKEL